MISAAHSRSGGEELLQAAVDGLPARAAEAALDDEAAVELVERVVRAFERSDTPGFSLRRARELSSEVGTQRER